MLTHAHTYISKQAAVPSYSILETVKEANHYLSPNAVWEYMGEERYVYKLIYTYICIHIPSNLYACIYMYMYICICIKNCAYV
jgi:hypothetical protein